MDMDDFGRIDDNDKDFQKPLRIFSDTPGDTPGDIKFGVIDNTFESVAEAVQEERLPPRQYENNKRKANCCSILTYWYANNLVENVNNNDGKLAPIMIEEMNSDPKRDEKLLTYFQTRLNSKYE